MMRTPQTRWFSARGLMCAVAALGLLPCESQPTQPSRPHAKAVIQIWMWGGPSQLDTFDPRPAAGPEYSGSLSKPISTNVPGIQIGELLPLLAQQADKYSLIRTMTHGSNAHETAAYRVLTGHEPGVGLVYPSLGALVSYLRGYGHGYTGLVPPYVVIPSTQNRFAEEGFLGPRYKAFATGGDPNKDPFAVEGVISPVLSDERQRSRRELLGALDTLGKAAPGTADFAKMDRCDNDAYNLILGNERKVFDLQQEPAAVRDRYGRNTFGQSCLAARRLIERGVPYVMINYPGWDTHKQHFEAMRRKLPELDQGLSALLQDLSDRGLLDTTVVWCCGEFGRTPKIMWEAPWNGGRGHWGSCFSALVAGGGFRGGHVVGVSDSKGEQVAERPVYPEDLLGSILELLGIDPDAKLPNDRGLDVPVMPLHAGPSGGRLKEIM